MSFGSSAGDLVIAVQLVGTLRRRFIDSPNQFRAISDETKALSNVLRDVEDVLSERELSSRQALELEDVSHGCYNVLRDLDAVVDKYHDLDPKWSHTGLKGRSRRLWKRLAWEPEDIKELRSRLSSNVALLNAFNGSLTSNLVHATNEGVSRLNRLHDASERRSIEEWLFPVDSAAQQSYSINQREEGTGLWLLESDSFRNWIDGDGKTLFCPGIPGAGKTIISSIVVDFLSHELQSHGDVGIAYLYCSYTRHKEQKLVDLMSCLLLQLMRAQPEPSRSVIEMCLRHIRKGTRPSVKEIVVATRAVVADYPRTFVIIDALDECSNEGRVRDMLLENIFKLQETFCVALFATSRPLPGIANKFQNKSCTSLEIRASDQDVQKYLEGHFTLLPSFVARNRNLQDSIQAAIGNSVDGMYASSRSVTMEQAKLRFRFLLAKLQLDSLTDKLTPKAMKLAMQRLPRGSEALDEAYGLAMERIDSQKIGCARLAGQVLSWLTFSKRQLSIPELCHALAVDSTMMRLDPDDLLDPDDMASVCAGLVVVDHESNIIRLVHYTTLTYLERAFHAEAAFHHNEIVMTCLTYLTFDTFAGGHCLTYEELGTRLRENPFLVYAARYWGVHACMASKSAKLEEAAMGLLENSPKLACSIQALHISASDTPCYSQAIPSNTLAVHLAAYLGSKWILMLLLQRGYPPDSPDKEGRTALQYAAGNGHEKIVKLLLECGNVRADFNSSKGPARLCGTPLSWASWCGHDAVVRLLVHRNDVNVNFKMPDGTTPLMRACILGHEKVARSLLDREDIDLNSRDEAKRTGLSFAAQNGHEAVVKLLLEKRDIEAHCENSNDEDSPLMWAAGRGHERVVQLLINHPDVDINSKNFVGVCPLSIAASRGHEAIVRLLLEQPGINADQRDNDGETPLSAAATEGHEGTVRLFLDRGDVDVDSRDYKGYSPISWAISRGHTSVVRMLAEREDVDADSKDNIGRTLLTWACCSTFAQSHAVEEPVKVLIERDDVKKDHKDDDGRTPLSWAAARKSTIIGEDAVAVVKLFVEREDVDIHSRDINDLTPYDWAVQTGNLEIATLLQVYSQRLPPPYTTSPSGLDSGETKRSTERSRLSLGS